MCHVITLYLEPISSFFGAYFAFDLFFLEILSIQTEIAVKRKRYTLFFYKNIFYKNIEAEIYEILRIF